MLRLAHRILNTKQIKRWSNYLAPDEVLREGFLSVKRRLQAGIPVIIADNVASYHARNFQAELDWKQLPPCLPSFNECFLEFNQPEETWGVVNDGDPRIVTPHELGFLQTGMLMNVQTSDSTDFARCMKYFPKFRRQAETRWLIVGEMVQTAVTGDLALICIWGLALDAEGKHLEADAGMLVKGAVGGFSLATVMLPLAFMQCSNVERIDVTKEEGSGPKWCRRQRVPELKYHALQIDPSIVHRASQTANRIGPGKAFHICRGHFTRFVNDGRSKGLFGRGRYGTFWVPAHSRGSVAHGRVVQTYNDTRHAFFCPWFQRCS